MPVSRTYRCLNCMEGTVTRSYDVSHLTRTCEACGEFERHVNQRVVDQYEEFEADPPEALDWDALDRTRKLVVAERVARHGRSVESLAGDRREPEIEGSEATDDDETGDDPADERAPADPAIAGESAETTAPDHGDGGGDADDTEGATDAADPSREAEPAETGGDSGPNPEAETDADPEAETDGETPAGHDSTPSGSD